MLDQTKGGPKNSQSVLIGVSVLIVIIILLAFLGSKSATPANEEEATHKESLTEIDANEEKILVGETFKYLLPQEWDGLVRAEKNIQALKEGQVIVPGIIQDPNEANIVYFASALINEIDQESLLSIYKYNTENYNFERLYKKTLEFRNPESAKTTALLGYDKGKLVLFDWENDVRPGPCVTPENFYYLGENYLLLDIQNPYDGFVDYTLPSEVMNEIDEDYQNCLDQL